MTYDQSDDLATRVVDLYVNQGRSIRQIAAEVERSFGWTRQTLLNNGVTLRPRGWHHTPNG